MNTDDLRAGFAELKISDDSLRTAQKNIDAQRNAAIRSFLSQLAEEFGTMTVFEDPAAEGMVSFVTHIATLEGDNLFMHPGHEQRAFNMVDHYLRAHRKDDEIKALPLNDGLMSFLKDFVETVNANDRRRLIDIPEGYVVFQLKFSGGAGGHDWDGPTVHQVYRDSLPKAFEELRQRYRSGGPDVCDFLDRIHVGLPDHTHWSELQFEGDRRHWPISISTEFPGLKLADPPTFP